MNNYQQTNPEEDDLVDRYLLEQLSREETIAFNNRLADDPSFQQVVNERKLLLVGIQESVLRSRLDDYHNNLQAGKPRVRRMNRWLIAAAIIGVLFLPLSWLLLRPSKPERLYTEYYQPDPGLISAMSASDNSEEEYQFEKAMIDYKTGNYQAALLSWKAIDQKADSDTLDYFIGSAYLALHQSTNAFIYFKKVLTRKESMFTSDACWYAGLALLQNGQSEEAIKYLRQSLHKDKDLLIRKLQQ